MSDTCCVCCFRNKIHVRQQERYEAINGSNDQSITHGCDLYVQLETIKKFTEAHEHFETHAFCFYEGEDGKYYNARVARYWGSNIITQVAGKKKEVLKVMQKIQSDSLYTNVCTMFFID